MNIEIASSTVRLIDAEGENVGVTDTQEAIQQAIDVGLDLVEISPNAKHLGTFDLVCTLPSN